MARTLGICFLSVIVFIQSANGQAQCNPEAIGGCTTVYVDGIQKASTDKNQVCRLTKAYSDCVTSSVYGCSIETVEKVRPQLEEAQRNMNENGCSPDGTYTGTGGCNGQGIMQCSQKFLKTFNQNADTEDVCSNVRVLMGCVEPKIQGCNADAREKFEKGIDQYRQILSEQCGAAATRLSLLTLLVTLLYVFFCG